MKPEGSTRRLREAAWREIEQRWETLGFDALEADERECIALFWLEGEVMNGGLAQYFANSSGDLAPLAASALARLGANRSLQLLTAAMRKLGAERYPLARDERIDLMTLAGKTNDPFDMETRQLQAQPEDFFGLALDALAGRYAVSAHPARPR